MISDSQKWVVRLIGVLMILGFILIFSNMIGKLKTLQNEQGKPPATRSP